VDDATNLYRVHRSGSDARRVLLSAERFSGAMHYEYMDLSVPG
jgi:hypothetical protein